MARRSLSRSEQGRTVRAVERGLCPGSPSLFPESGSPRPGLRSEGMGGHLLRPAPGLQAQGRAPSPEHRRRGTLRPGRLSRSPAVRVPGVSGPLLLLQRNLSTTSGFRRRPG